MKPEEFAMELQKKYPSFGKKIIYDKTASGDDFCEIIYENKDRPSHLLTVTIFCDGAELSFGSVSFFTGKKKLSLPETIQAIDDIIGDKTIFVFQYENRKGMESGRIIDRDIYALTGDKDDMTKEYRKFISEISAPIGKFKRLFTNLKGLFVITNFSGSINMEIER